MTYFDDIYETAADNYGLVTTAQANEIGASNKDLTRYVGSGRLQRLGRGVYRVRYWVPTENDPYAVAVALVGEGAYLHGESVIAMHGLAPTNPARIEVATARRVRRKLPSTIRLVRGSVEDETTEYDGIPSQSIPSAIRSCRNKMMPKRLADAARRARALGLINTREEDSLLNEVEAW